MEEIQTQERVGIKAIQIMEGEYTETRDRVGTFPTHFSCTMTDLEKRSSTLWSIEKRISNELGSKPKSIRSRSETEFIKEVDKSKNSSNLLKIKKLNNIDLKVEECRNVNQSKGLVYLNGQKPKIHQNDLQEIKKKTKVGTY